MLRRTNVTQVKPVFVNVIRHYPNVDSLARASATHLHKLLRPLGLTWRAENIRRMAKVLSADFDLTIPRTYDELRQLPGVGDYVASAVCSFAYNMPVPIIDSNTVRVVGRYFGIKTNAESRRSRSLREVIVAVTRRRNSRHYNYYFLDFASVICKPINPQCRNCPLKSSCAFGITKLGD